MRLKLNYFVGDMKTVFLEKWASVVLESDCLAEKS